MDLHLSNVCFFFHFRMCAFILLCIIWDLNGWTEKTLNEKRENKVVEERWCGTFIGQAGRGCRKLAL